MTTPTPVIGFIGTGSIGGGLAALTTAAGLNVVLSNSRGPASLDELVSTLGDSASADTVAGAIERADIVVLSVPLTAYAEIPAAALAGKVVIETTNYYPARFGTLAEIDESGLPSSEFLQQRWPEARLVKALNNVDFIRLPRLARPVGDPERSALPVASDDDDAKAQAIAYLGRIGFDALDLGVLADSWRFEPGTPIHVAPYARDQEPLIADPYQRFLQAETVPVPLDQAKLLADTATRA